MLGERLWRRFACLGVIAVALFAIAGCGSDSDDNSSTSGASTSADSGDKDPILIGAAIAKSGGFAPFDAPPIAALKLKIDDINAKGGVMGRQIKYIEKDTHSEVDQVGAAATSLLEDGADVIITTCDVDQGAPAAVEAIKENKLVVSTCAGSIDFGPAALGPLAFTFGAAAQSQGNGMAEFAYNTLGVKRPYILLDNSISFTQEYCKAFKERWTELAGADSIAGEDTFQQGDQSISGQISRMKRVSPPPDSIVLCSYSPGDAQAVRQFRAAGLEQPILGDQTLDGDSWKKAVPNASDLYYPATASIYGDDPNDEVNAFFDEYEKREGSRAPSSLAVTGADAMQAIADAADKAQSLDGDKLAEALVASKDMPLLGGPTTFTEQAHIPLNRPIRVMVVTDGETSFKASQDPKVDSP